MKSIQDIVYNGFGQKLDLNLPDGETKAVFVYFHGGGLEAGSKKADAAYHKYLTERGIAVADVNYRMYPEAKFPEFISDAADAVKWVKDHLPEYGIPEKIFVGGSSAGGYLSMMLCFDEKYLSERGIAPNSLAGYVHDAGQPTTHFNVLRERGVDTRRVIVDEAAPLYHIGKNGNACTDMLFIVSDNDMQNRYEQTMLTLSTLKHFGYPDEKIDLIVMNGKHCAYSLRVDEDGESAFGKIVYPFFEKCMGV